MIHITDKQVAELLDYRSVTAELERAFPDFPTIRRRFTATNAARAAEHGSAQWVPSGSTRRCLP